MERINSPSGGETKRVANGSETNQCSNAPGPDTRVLNHIRDREDSDAWREFATRHGAWMVAYFQSKNMNRALAEELVVDVLSKFGRSITTFSSPRDEAHRWLLRVADAIWIEVLATWTERIGFRAAQATTPEEFVNEFLVELAWKNTERRLINMDPQNAERGCRIFLRHRRGRESLKVIAHEEGLKNPEVAKSIWRVGTIFKEEVKKLTGGQT